jgi:alpha-glucosidase
LPFVAHADALSAQAQAHDPASTLALTRALAELRRTTRELREGEQRLLDAAPGVLAFTRGETIVAAINFRGEPAPLPAAGARLISTDPHRAGHLRPYEAVLLKRG